ncbi:MAG TPA: adenylate/guanylate cyclase domain-containing protein [Anaerolineales bacterium]
MNESEQLQQAIAALEAQRGILGDSIVEIALAPLREKLALLRDPNGSTEYTSEEQLRLTGGRTVSEPPSLGEQRKLVTVLFADLVGFTALAERLDPEDVREVLNSYYNRLAAPIEQYGGVIEKFIGDALMAVFGLQAAREDDPERAIRAALAMRAALASLNEELERERGLRLSMRVGIHTGPALVSLLGDPSRPGGRRDFVVVGDTVNLASRLQSNAPTDGILISHSTYLHTRGVFDIQPLGPIQVKGKQEPVEAYVVLRTKQRSFRRERHNVAGIETSLVGRVGEMEILKDTLRQTISQSEPHLVTVLGQAGLGKSRLIEEFENWVELLPQEILGLRGSASHYLQNQPYSLLRDTISFRFQMQDSDPPDVVRQKLEAGFGDPPSAHLIGQLIGFDFSTSPYLLGLKDNPQQIHDQALATIIKYFKGQASQRPVMVILQDLQWADDSSLGLLDSLWGHLPGLPVLVVCAARPELLERKPDWGSKPARHAIRLELHPFSPAESLSLVNGILQKVADLPADLSQLILRNAEGNPFYIEELVKMLLEDKVILLEEPNWQVVIERLETVRIPPTLTEVLQARLDSLPLAERVVLQRASVVGRTFWDEAIEYLEDHLPEHSMALNPNPETPRLLDELRAREVIQRRETSAFDQVNEYFFAHTLLRDVTYESVLKRQRRIYHARAASWLERATAHSHRVGEFAALIAEHYEQAQDPAKAAHWYRLAGEQASARFANAESVHDFSRALELTPAQNLAERFSLLLAREKVFDRQGNRQEQARDLHVLADLAEQLHEQGLQAAVLLRQASLAFVTADYARAVEASRQALPLAQAAGDVKGETESLVIWGKTLIWLGESQEATVHLDKARELAHAAQLSGMEADSLFNLSIGANNSSEYGRASALLEQALEIYRANGDRAGEAAALGQAGVISAGQGDFTRARQYFETALHISQALGYRMRESILLQNIGAIAYEQGDLEEAASLDNQALQIYHQTGDKNGMCGALSNLADIARVEGLFEKARNYYEQGLQIARETGDRPTEGLLMANTSLLYLEIGDASAAEELNRRAISLFREMNLPIYEMYSLPRLAQAQAAAGQAETAAQSFREALALQEKLGLKNNQMETRAGLASLALGAGDLAQARTQVELILEHLNTGDLVGTDAPFQIYLTCIQVLQAAQDIRAQELLVKAHHLLVERANKIKDEAIRRSYLEYAPGSCELLDLWDNREEIRDR